MYLSTLTIPANTSKQTPVEQTFPLEKGLIRDLTVFFPYGCAGLAGIQVIRNTWQLAPLSRGYWFTGNDIVYKVELSYNLDVAPFDLIIRGYNEDDTFEHTPVVTVDIVRNQVTSQLKSFLEAIGLG